MPAAPGRERIVQGIVVDAEGRPVRNASVVAVRREKTAEPATTAADGTFKLRVGGFMLVEEDLVASADGGKLMGLSKFVEPRTSEPPEPVRITLKPSRAIAVHVRDAKDQAVEGSTVAAVGFGYDGAATTDAGGNAVLRVPAEAEVRWLIGLKAGAGFDYFENYRSHPAGDIGPLPPEVTLRLDGSRTVRIKAVDTAGRPVAGAELRPGLSESRRSSIERTLEVQRLYGHARMPPAWRRSAGFPVLRTSPFRSCCFPANTHAPRRLLTEAVMERSWWHDCCGIRESAGLCVMRTGGPRRAF